jgi:hypothetical protein
MPNINLSLTAELLDRIDGARGDVSRTKYLNRTLAWALDELEVPTAEERGAIKDRQATVAARRSAPLGAPPTEEAP